MRSHRVATDIFATLVLRSESLPARLQELDARWHTPVGTLRGSGGRCQRGIFEGRMRAIHYLIDYAGKTLSPPFYALRQTPIGDLAEPALIGHAVATLGY